MPIFFFFVQSVDFQVEEELLEQEFLERCFQEMLDEEDQDWFIPARDLPSGVGQLQQQLNGLSVNDVSTEDIVVSRLMPCHLGSMCWDETSGLAACLTRSSVLFPSARAA